MKQNRALMSLLCYAGLVLGAERAAQATVIGARGGYVLPDDSNDPQYECFKDSWGGVENVGGPTFCAAPTWEVPVPLAREGTATTFSFSVWGQATAAAAEEMVTCQAIGLLLPEGTPVWAEANNFSPIPGRWGINAGSFSNVLPGWGVQASDLAYVDCTVPPGVLLTSVQWNGGLVAGQGSIEGSAGYPAGNTSPSCFSVQNGMVQATGAAGCGNAAWQVPVPLDTQSSAGPALCAEAFVANASNDGSDGSRCAFDIVNQDGVLQSWTGWSSVFDMTGTSGRIGGLSPSPAQGSHAFMTCELPANEILRSVSVATNCPQY